MGHGTRPARWSRCRRRRAGCRPAGRPASGDGHADAAARTRSACRSSRRTIRPVWRWPSGCRTLRSDRCDTLRPARSAPQRGIGTGRGLRRSCLTGSGAVRDALVGFAADVPTVRRSRELPRAHPGATRCPAVPRPPAAGPAGATDRTRHDRPARWSAAAARTCPASTASCSIRPTSRRSRPRAISCRPTSPRPSSSAHAPGLLVRGAAGGPARPVRAHHPGRPGGGCRAARPEPGQLGRGGTPAGRAGGSSAAAAAHPGHRRRARPVARQPAAAGAARRGRRR